MILKTLVDYYERMLADPKADVPPPGWFHGKLDFSIVLDKQGCFRRIKSLQINKSGRFVGRKTLLPYLGKQALKHNNSGKDANLLWDNATFVLGIGKNGDVKLNSFICAIEENFSDLTEELNAVITFLKDGQKEKNHFTPIVDHPEYGEVIRKGQVALTFEYEEDMGKLVFLRERIRQRISSVADGDSLLGDCLVTGKSRQPIEECHTVIKNLFRAKKDPNLVSFNAPAFESYGKSQSLNAPVSKKAAFAYTTILNYLFRDGSKQKIQVGDASTVFWAGEKHPFEEDFSGFLGEPPRGEEPDYGKIRALLTAAKTGVPPPDEQISFYVLGLAPNASRIAVRFWYEGTIRDIKEKIVQHFEDIDIVHAPHEREYLSLFQLLVATAAEGKVDNIPPNLGGEVARAVLNGTGYPRTLFSGALRRCKAEQKVTRQRAAAIKAFLVRDSRLRGRTREEVGMNLDTENKNMGYVLGRLFAVLERIQEQAQSGLNKTIRDTYFSAATSNPLVTFKRLQDLAIHHLAKIRNSGKSTVWLEKRMGEVMSKIPADGIPAFLSLEDQGRFAVGYYHQRQDFFNSRQTEEKERDHE